MLIPAIAIGVVAIIAVLVIRQLLRVGEEVQHDAKVLARRCKQLELITDAVPLLLIYIESNQVVRYLNTAAQRWFSKQVNTTTHLHLSDLFGCDLYAAVEAQVENALTGESLNYGNVPTLTADDPRTYSLNYIPDIDSNSKVQGVLIVVEDITDQMRALKKLGSAEMRVAEMKVIRSTAATYAHEINNPLAGIICCTQMIADGDVQGDDCCEMAAEVLDAAKRIATVTKQLAELEQPSYKDYAIGDTQIIDLTEAH